MAVWRISSRIATAALLGLVALDVALVAAALKSTHPSGSNASSVSSASVASTTTDSRTAPVGPSATTSGTAVTAPLQTMLVALDDQRAWRVGSGSCSAGGATLATTVDGGKTWTKGRANLRQIVRVRPTDNRVAFVIGADQSCVAELRHTTDAGGTWAGGGNVGSAWFRDPGNPLVVRAPGPSRSQPCGKQAVLDLAVIATGSARVLCADGLVRSTTDIGSVWTDAGQLDGAVALAVSTVNPAETYVALLGAPDCAGVQILRVRQQVAIACIRAPIPPGPGQIAISLTRSGGWLVVGDTTMRSTDDLVTWSVS